MLNYIRARFLNYENLLKVSEDTLGPFAVCCYSVVKDRSPAKRCFVGCDWCRDEMSNLINLKNSVKIYFSFISASIALKSLPITRAPRTEQTYIIALRLSTPFSLKSSIYSIGLRLTLISRFYVINVLIFNGDGIMKNPALRLIGRLYESISAASKILQEIINEGVRSKMELFNQWRKNEGTPWRLE